MNLHTEEILDSIRSVYKDATTTPQGEYTLNTNLIITCTVLSDAELFAKLEAAYDQGYDQGYHDGFSDGEESAR